jgi:bifunctional ADP-heptose synthase (sugar kinase/adenylyltransferase)
MAAAEASTACSVSGAKRAPSSSESSAPLLRVLIAARECEREREQCCALCAAAAAVVVVATAAAAVAVQELPIYLKQTACDELEQKRLHMCAQ